MRLPRTASATRSWTRHTVALIGSEGGIGHSLSTTLSTRGASVHNLDISTGFDATDQDVVIPWFRDHPEVTTVIYAAGIAASGPLIDGPGVRQLADTVTTNVVGMLNVAAAAAPALREHAGRLVTLNSAFSLVTAHGYGAYSVSKAGLRAATDALRPELTPATVTDCLLGGIDTPIFDRAADRDPTPATAAVARSFHRRIARQSPDDAAAAILRAAHARKFRPCIGIDALLTKVAVMLLPSLTQRTVLQLIGDYPAAR